jgi:hypothetical protein
LSSDGNNFGFVLKDEDPVPDLHVGMNAVRLMSAQWQNSLIENTPLTVWLDFRWFMLHLVES